MRAVLSAITAALLFISTPVAAKSLTDVREAEDAVSPLDTEENTHPPLDEEESTSPSSPDKKASAPVKEKDSDASSSEPSSPALAATTSAAQRVDAQKTDLTDEEEELKKIQQDSELARKKVEQALTTLTAALTTQKEALPILQQTLTDILQQMGVHMGNNKNLLAELAVQFQQKSEVLGTKKSAIKTYEDTIASLTAANQAKEEDLKRLRAQKEEIQAKKQAITDTVSAMLDEHK